MLAAAVSEIVAPHERINGIAHRAGCLLNVLVAFYSNANRDTELTDDTLCEVLSQVRADLSRIEVLTRTPG
ncbi:hypothetical protein LAV84_27810 [Rhizobium sp. VS19-DR104.2]|nr:MULTISPECIES: hypothetical protein [unclassified Rhizobium]MBZ5763345.1 hypothetical protein [Rhizobium sp. VS19-DR96]MBZ5769240.1 hypothetical protein [Rhizobium sp. VS19-DR129.2]MBZ5776765.1 hypothetical protein [Rhizobium sp. VS19-DRK62.2]MBZ5786647.1 hypothetical protein [Rhizobium sp. VS19-DR121]MBZ5805298.1 hypothetical protein [Rhizobium sp. VS19-DR181]